MQDHRDPVVYRNIWIVDRGLVDGVTFPVLSPTPEQLEQEALEAKRAAEALAAEKAAQEKVAAEKAAAEKAAAEKAAAEKDSLGEPPQEAATTSTEATIPPSDSKPTDS